MKRNRCSFCVGLVCVTVLWTLAGCSGTLRPEPERARIIFFGDSITELGEKPGGYVRRVRDSLASSGSALDIVGAGISGNKIGDLLARVDRDVLSRRPSIVVIYIGINDVWHYAFAARGLTGTPVDQFRSGLTTLITTLHTAGVRTVLCTPSVIGEKKHGANPYDAKLEEYSAVSRDVASETGATLCDLRRAFTAFIAANNPTDTDKNILTYDGVHLNDTGNRLVAGEILKVLDGLGIFFPQK